MAKVVLQNGLVPHAVDLHPEGLLPTVEDLEAARTRLTRVLVVAHLFGSRTPLAEIAEWCRRHDILLVEDAAQAYAGLIDPDPAADVSMFSFGLIKTATAIGGAVVCVRDADLAERMRAAEREWPTQDLRVYRRKVRKAGHLILLGLGPVFGTCAWLARRFGIDLDRKLYDATRGFPGDGLMKQLRQRPCASLLANLDAALRADIRGRVARRSENGDRVGHELMDRVPGMSVASRTHWVLPWIVTEREVDVRVLRDAGFDVAPRSSLSVIPAAPGRDAPRIAQGLLDSLIFLPCYAGMPRSEADRMAQVLGSEGSV
tara:strand:- start:25710 stop:26657 length:948 start_codon:yes stop_codon:yes gene_type:complete